MMELNILIQFAPKYTKLKLVLEPDLIPIEDLPGFQVFNWYITILQDAYLLLILKV